MGLRQGVRVEGRLAVDGRVVDRHPFRVEARTVGMQRNLVRRRKRLLRGKGHRRSVPEHLQRLELAVLQVTRLLRHVPEQEAVRPPRGATRLVRAAGVLGDPDVPVRVVLDALVAAAAEGAGDVLDRRGNGEVGGPDAAGRPELGGEEQALRPRVPGRPVERRQRLPVLVRRCQQRHSMRRVGVEVDPRDASPASRPRAPGRGSDCRSRSRSRRPRALA